MCLGRVDGDFDKASLVRARLDYREDSQAPCMTMIAPSLRERVARSRLLRYGLAMLGPFGGAVTQFVLSVQMLHALSPASFGGFAFLLVLFQFGMGISSALFCTPLPIVLHASGSFDAEARRRAVFAGNLTYCLVAGILFWLLGIALELSAGGAILFAIYAALALLRWFARAFAYATGKAQRTVASDIVYCLVLGLSIVLLWLKGVDSVADPAAALLVSAAAALVPFGMDYLRKQISGYRPVDLLNYLPVWHEHARWALVGVTTIEATANAHAYIVTSLAGPSAFAPLAATALLIRPLGVIMNTLGEFERPRLARAIAQNAPTGELRGTVRIAWIVLTVAWFGTAAVAFILLLYAPHLVFPTKYSRGDLLIGAALWIVVAAARCWRAPESTLLQAAGRFRGLAFASLVSCWISVAAVVAALLLYGPLASLGGVMLGEIVFAIWVTREARRWQVVYRAGGPKSAMESRA